MDPNLILIKLNEKQVAELATICDQALKANGLRVLDVVNTIQNQVNEQIKNKK